MRMPLIGAVADDLTGATTTGFYLQGQKLGQQYFLMKKLQKKRQPAKNWMPFL